QAKAKLDNAAAPMDGNRCMFINPDAEITIVDNLKSLFQASDEIKTQYKEAMMGRTAGFDWYMDQQIYVHTVGTLGGTPTTNGVPTSGSSNIVTQAWTSTTLNAGDVISF